MSEIQPDLFGDYDRSEQLAALRNQPVECPSCGIVAPNAIRLENSHGYRVTPEGIEGIGGFPIGEHPIYGEMCVAQALKRNHIIYGVRNGEDVTRDVASGRELGLDVDAIIAEAEAIRDAVDLALRIWIRHPQMEADYQIGQHPHGYWAARFSAKALGSGHAWESPWGGAHHGWQDRAAALEWVLTGIVRRCAAWDLDVDDLEGEIRQQSARAEREIA